MAREKPSQSGSRQRPPTGQQPGQAEQRRPYNPANPGPGEQQNRRPATQRSLPQPSRRWASSATPRAATVAGWSILPLRLFLAFSFLVAGWDKLSDPGYLDPASRDYIGAQISRFAQGTPLEGFLMSMAVPNATLFGVLVMGGELLISVAVLLGVLTRFSALMGLLLNLTFFLSATWDVRPFYFGADLPYVFAWLTLLLAGPGPYALDWIVREWLAEQPIATHGKVVPSTYYEDSSPAMSRRAFLGMGATVLAGALMAGTGALWAVAHPASASRLRTAAGSSGSATGGGTSAATTPGDAAALPPATAASPARPASSTPAPTEKSEDEGSEGQEQPPTAAAQPTETTVPAQENPSTGQLLAKAGDLPNGEVATFQLPTGEPAVLLHNDAGYLAYVAICTHEGCRVQPVAGGLLGCPCHGARFDPNAGGQAVRGPARRPLSPIALNVDGQGNVYLAP